MNFITIVTIKLRYAHAFLIDWKIPYKHYLSREIGYTIIYAIFCKKKKKMTKINSWYFLHKLPTIKIQVICTSLMYWYFQLICELKNFLS